MIQRIQSLYLLAAALLLGATWLAPVRVWRLAAGQVRFMTRGLEADAGLSVDAAALPLPYHLILSLLAIGFLAAIFLFARRPRQMRVARGLWLVALVMAVMQWISCNSIDAWLAQGDRPQGAYGASFFLPFAAVGLGILAERAIRRDEELVRSADRLR